jgi:hypothetical protein
MRTTIDIPEHLLIEAKKVAASRRTSLTRIVEASLRAYIAAERTARGKKKVASLPVNRKARPVAGVDLDDTSGLLEIP